MGTGTRTRKSPAAAAEFQHLLDDVLTEADADDHAGPLLRAAGLRIRFDFPDLPLVLSLAATEKGSHHVTWKFSDEVDWKPKLKLRMDSKVANAYLQGKESLAIAIARGRVKASGDTRSALVYIPALRLLVSSYRQARDPGAPASGARVGAAQAPKFSLTPAPRERSLRGREIGNRPQWVPLRGPSATGADGAGPRGVHGAVGRRSGPKARGRRGSASPVALRCEPLLPGDPERIDPRCPTITSL